MAYGGVSAGPSGPSGSKGSGAGVGAGYDPNATESVNYALAQRRQRALDALVNNQMNQPNVNVVGPVAPAKPATPAPDPYAPPKYYSVLNSDLSGWANPNAQTGGSSGVLNGLFGGFSKDSTSKPTMGSGANSNFNIENTNDPSYFNKLSEYATSTTDSPWLSQMKSSLNTQKMQNISDIAQQTAAAGTTAREQLASRRGLASGASERIATQGGLAGMFARQKANLDYGNQAQTAGIEEARQKMTVQQALPGMELQRATQATNVQQMNLENLMKERANQNAAAMEAYKIRMSAWGAEQQANATANANDTSGLNVLGLQIFK